MPSYPSLERILTQLRLGREAMPEAASVLDLQIALLEIALAVEIPPTIPPISAAQATERRQQGLPLVTGRELALDWQALTAYHQQVCQLGAQHRPDLAEPFTALAALGPAEIESGARQIMVSGRVADELATFCLTHALRPFLRHLTAAYQHLIDQEGWQRGHCPICGGEPDMARIDPLDEGTRYLLCTRCDFEWRYPRIGCPFCDTHEAGQLHYFTEENGPHRLYVCESCRRYLKAIDLRLANGGRVLMPVERLLTVNMDVAAREQGYT